jgi:adenosylcobinamide kinase/adenosylcobinamide-phosphate guanylyltransferase
MTSVSIPRLTFVLGGARSGKSAFSERLACETGLERHYVATGRAWDDEMRARIAKHREDRGEGWQTHEVPLDLQGGLSAIAAPGRVILVDCLTLWITNLMMETPEAVDEAGRSMVAALSGLEGHIIFVSNEVGLGIVPDNKMARAFRDHAGRLHQALAAASDAVYFVAAGLPLKMKGA